VLDETFAQHPAYAWLVDHAHFFGFILRYPEGKEGITGYSYEPWHFRFVGLETAAKIHKKGLTLEEFTD
jgi:D-alanyl-D-alanine carboxypeptidase